ncbi:MAG TPA: peptide-methionine (S)-S-oxide reductase MsrA [SAR86 cluster bacterium]|jgi:peptide methionine sulfoxide reductase msrA/msrB|nr:peptide-methionine (S)-S-oxide reductase MsrA [SAR86 cluster bacterium]HJM14971.1 peptide-methionine (S)-S-oxide reductase MsrA [SAR86 cluster bacterium]|tara:strand:+ start:544 stop:1785 length:1242 start_codon:yes stop_codon:yes gene_type:complete
MLVFLSINLASENNQSTSHLEKIVLGSGCFWGAEKGYEELPGVIDAVSGYADGYGIRPSYREITKFINKFNPNNYAEVVEVTYNKNIISTEELLQHYFESHDPTQLNQQGNDIGTQYRSIVLYTNKEQQRIVENLVFEFQQLLTDSGYGQIATIIKSLDEFFQAENYHQDYIAKNPNGYCPDHSTGIRFSKNNLVEQKDNSELLEGKSVLVIEPQSYCPYCEKFKSLVVEKYKGNIPINFRLALQLDGIQLETPTWATPTIIFLEQGKEVFGHQGYMSPQEFYKALGFFKLGGSEAYRVAFEEGTDSRFCKEYEIFKNTPDGIFIDKLSGAHLFDTRDRFNSGTGWLSFTKPVDGSVYRRADNSYGMRRIEIRSKTSDIHLGHVFPDGPNGLPRYCINATVLEFKNRKEIDKS